MRTALTIGNPQLAEQLTTGVEPRTPYHEHALTTANAALAEAHGDHQAAADGYADAAQRWESFGVVPEQAFALLGHGRCLLALGRPHRATQPLHQARDIFTRLQAAPASPSATPSSPRPRNAPPERRDIEERGTRPGGFEPPTRGSEVRRSVP